MKHLFYILVILGIQSCDSTTSVAVKDNASKNSEVEQEDNIWSSIDSKRDWFVNGSKEYKTFDSLPTEFNEFYTRFISDSVFQRENVQFPILGAIAECDSTIALNKNNWEFLQFDFRSDFNNSMVSNTIYLTKSKIFIEDNRDEVGVIFQMGFEKVKDKWVLTLFMINNC